MGRNPFLAGIGLAESVLSQALALWKTPLDLVRGASGEEKILKNAKDTCASEALEIATYTALEQVANGGWRIRPPPSSPRRSAPTSSGCSIASCVSFPSWRARSCGPRSTVTRPTTSRKPGPRTRSARRPRRPKRVTRSAKAGAKRTARQARKVPGVARAEGQVKGAVAGECDLAIAGYDKLTVDEIVARLAELSQIDLAKVNAYERTTHNRATVLTRITALQRRRAVARLRRAHGRGDPRSRRRRRRAHEHRAQLRARAQEPRRRAERRRARAHHRLV